MPEKISIIIPCRNEEENLERALRVIRETFRERVPEILVVISPSTDRTAQIANTEASRHGHIRVLELARDEGKGGAVRAGAMSADGDIVVFLDADLSVPPEAIFPLVAEIEKGADLAIASRRHPKSVILKKQPLLRDKLGRIFNRIVRLLTGLPWRDTQCGCKAFRKSVAEILFQPLRTRGFSFDVEILYRARNHHMRVVELPITWADSSRSSISILRDGPSMFACVLGIVVRRLLHRL